MEIRALLKQPNPLDSEPSDVKSTILRLSHNLLRKHCINPLDDDLTLLFGHISDDTNSRAICTWIYRELSEYGEVDSASALKELDKNFHEKMSNIDLLVQE